nr:ribonuclease H-like domain-containing protein [Tanacetum cinerariifolium]
MSTRQDIYADGSENCPPMLNKENYVSWSSRLLRYAKSRPNGKLIYNFIINGPYVRQMIPEPDQDRQMQMVRGNGENQFRQYARQNVRNHNGYNVVQNVRNQVVQNAVQNLGVQNVGNPNRLIVVLRIANQNPNRNDNVVAARAEGNVIGNNADLDEIEEVNPNCILMANLQQASTSGTQTNKAPVYDSNGSAGVHNYDNCYDNEIFNMFTQEDQYTELLEPIPEPHKVQ